MNALLENFCTPPFFPVTEHDEKSLADAERIRIPFESNMLNCYVMGTGKTIILGHGWGSRASHLALIAKALVNAGFRTILFDAPAHSSCEIPRFKTTSSMFEYCRALHTVAEHFSPIYAVLGHSIGAISSVLTTGGYKMMQNYKITPEKLVLLSMPASMEVLLEAYHKQHSLTPEESLQLNESLEKDFDFKIEDYSVEYVLGDITSSILMVHDEDDDQVPINKIYDLHKKFPDIELLTTRHYGHDKIILNRQLISKAIEFFKE